MRHTVLVVDDESNVRCALLRLLRKESYEILTANSAEDAVQFVQRYPIDVIVTDNRMAGMRGVDFLNWVRDVNPSVVRIMLTGDANVATIRTLEDGTAHYVFSKPCNVAELVLTIRTALGECDQSRVDVSA